LADVCGVLLIANIIRIFFWLGNRFETRMLISPLSLQIPLADDPALLVQSILLIVSQLLLLSICLHYRSPPSSPSAVYAPLSPMFDRSTSADPVHRSSSPIGGRLNSISRKKSLAAFFASRPFGFWQWPELGQYLEFLAGLIVTLGILQLILGRWMWYIDA
jgi:hypothetical protein